MILLIAFVANSIGFYSSSYIPFWNRDHVCSDVNSIRIMCVISRNHGYGVISGITNRDYVPKRRKQIKSIRTESDGQRGMITEPSSILYYLYLYIYLIKNYARFPVENFVHPPVHPHERSVLTVYLTSPICCGGCCITKNIYIIKF